MTPDLYERLEAAAKRRGMPPAKRPCKDCGATANAADESKTAKGDDHFVRGADN